MLSGYGTRPMFTIPAGRLKRKITFEQRSATQDSIGGASNTWTPVAGLSDVPSRIEPLSGTEKLKAQAIHSSLSHRISIRYQTQFSDPLTASEWRIKYGTRIFNIISIINHNERNHWITIDCIEVGTAS